MIVKTLLAAVVAGLIAGVFMTAAQQARIVPLILHAEQYEGKEPASVIPGTDTPAAVQSENHEHSSLAPPSFPTDILDALSPVTPAHAHEGEHDDGGIMFGMSRFSGTLIANLVAGAGFGLLLAGVSMLIARPVTLSNGALWGAFGWLAIHLLPAIGLPPELPGFPAADLGDRQAWWMATIALSSVGLYLLALRPEIAAKIIGLLLIAAPHVYGAPQPADLSSAVPAVLGAEFAVAALATALAFWIVLGIVSGILNDRLARMA
ncbi:CbtA family protein [Pararhizobium antarcticum]|uniref:Cobalt transporter n=1 Tax=Pararhizobium antarcticum TaxID=1798805 RepID=A0A657LXD7_9HYPH|nr:CbtA family protein [Pararhizobium antarcticum]OJF93294.1 cobalt transporter [Rhizobium sp. 58]OJF99536.1 cobalt transporter [Pararhizobium antarcticum]